MTPRVSIVTTVYDRVACLRRCIRSVQKLQYRDFRCAPTPESGI
jgi:glycosyltransferase involved in cell wall biosynthesis